MEGRRDDGHVGGKLAVYIKQQSSYLKFLLSSSLLFHCKLAQGRSALQAEIIIIMKILDDNKVRLGGRGENVCTCVCCNSA